MEGLALNDLEGGERSDGETDEEREKDRMFINASRDVMSPGIKRESDKG